MLDFLTLASPDDGLHPGLGALDVRKAPFSERSEDGRCDAPQKPSSHDTSRIAWAKLLARVREEFPLECPNCGGDIRLAAAVRDS